jgi:hypothetical protein
MLCVSRVEYHTAILPAQIRTSFQLVSTATLSEQVLGHFRGSDPGRYYTISPRHGISMGQDFERNRGYDEEGRGKDTNERMGTSLG